MKIFIPAIHGHDEHEFLFPFGFHFCLFLLNGHSTRFVSFLIITPLTKSLLPTSLLFRSNGGTFGNTFSKIIKIAFILLVTILLVEYSILNTRAFWSLFLFQLQTCFRSTKWDSINSFRSCKSRSIRWRANSSNLSITKYKMWTSNFSEEKKYPAPPYDQFCRIY